MELTNKELALIARARLAVARARVTRIVLLCLMVAGLSAMVYGAISPDYFAYFAFSIVIFALLLPQFGGPAYADLVVLLTRIQASTGPRAIDPLVRMLAEQP